MNFSLAFFICLVTSVLSLHGQATQYLSNTTSIFQISSVTNNWSLVNQMDCPTATCIGFDGYNRPYILNTWDTNSFGKIYTLRNGQWIALSYLSALTAAKIPTPQPNVYTRGLSGQITFDAQDAMYVTFGAPAASDTNGHTNMNGNMVLLYSTNYGTNFTAYPLNTRPYATTMESANAGVPLQHPPVISWLNTALSVSYTNSIAYAWPSDAPAIPSFASYAPLNVLIPQKKTNGLSFPPSILISTNVNGSSSRSISTGNNIYIAYLELPSANFLPQGFNPTYVSQINRSNQVIVNKKFIVNAFPFEPDNHAIPELISDRNSALHIIAGSHGWNFAHYGFQYLHAVGADQDQKWSRPNLLGMAQTYPRAVCDSKGNIHMSFRVHPCLQYLKRNSSGLWNPPINLVAAPPEQLNQYNNFYCNVYVDNQDVIYMTLSDSVSSANTGTVDNTSAYPYILIVSEDGGSSWQLASTAAFMRHISLTVPALQVKN